MSKLRVWHIPQVPMKAFHVDVETSEEAIKVLNTALSPIIVTRKGRKNGARKKTIGANGTMRTGAIFESMRKSWRERNRVRK